MSFKPIKVMDVELSNPLEDLNDLDSYGALKTLLRFYGTPIGYVQLPLHGGRCTARALGKAILDQHSRTIINHLLRIGLAEPLPPDGLRIADLVNMSPPIDNGPLLLVTVAVCTRNRTADLSLCLESLSCLDYPSLEILVVDNAPSTDATEKLVRTRYPNVRYVCEPRPGLDWARNRAIAEARGEIIAYTDDDVVVDPGWISAIVLVFSENLDVMAVTGLIVPYELETEAQILFEKYGGFGRGFERKWYRLDRESKKTEKYHIGSGIFGTGANMAYRRSLFEQLGGFDPALDVGTVTNGGGDLEMFFRVLQEGHTLVYEPNAVVRHRHCRKYDQLRIQLTNYGIGLYSYFVRAALAYPRERLGVLRLGLWWLWWWSMRRLLISFVFPARFPRDLILAEYRGSFLGLVRYFKARRIAKKIARRFNRVKTFTPKSQLGTPIVLTDHFDKLRAGSAKRSVESCDAWSERPLANSLLRGDQVSYPYPAAIRMVELCRPLQPLTDVKEYKNVRIFVTLGGRLLGMVNIFNNRQNIGVTRLKDAIVENLACELLEPGHYESKEFIWSKALAALKKRYLPPEGESTT
jgi:GT2 family glycosyltransferase